jgi:hypothetical protein
LFKLINIIVLSLFLVICSYAQTKYKNVLITTENEPNEVSAAVHPFDNNFLVLGSNIDNFYLSSDGGLNWTTKKLTNPVHGVWGDPVLVFDTKGSLYYFHLASSTNHWYDAIVCEKSYDGGITWNDTGVAFGQNSPHMQDKEWAVCDLTYSPYRNNIYAVWTQCGQDYYESEGATSNPEINKGTNIFFSRSTDEGSSWSDMLRLNDSSGTPCSVVDKTVLGATNCIGVNGEVFVTWVSGEGLIFDKSTDAGYTWLYKDILVSKIPNGFKFEIPGIYRSFGFPSIACDQSYSLYRGNIYISWADQRNGTEDTDIWLAKSTDNGNSWLQPKRINNDITARHQFFNWITIDQSTGYIYIVFYDRRNYDDEETDVYLARSADGGETFTNERISQWSFKPDASTFFGDYISITAINGKIRPYWSRLEDTKLSLWTAIIDE